MASKYAGVSAAGRGPDDTNWRCASGSGDLDATGSDLSLALCQNRRQDPPPFDPEPATIGAPESAFLHPLIYPFSKPDVHPLSATPRVREPSKSVWPGGVPVSIDNTAIVIWRHSGIALERGRMRSARADAARTVAAAS